MNEYTLHLQDRYFDSIKAGRKTIEMRLLDEKRRKYNVGDILIFECMSDDSQILKTKIVALHKFANFQELYPNFDKVKLGYYDNEIADPKDMEQFYSLDEQNKYGVVGIEIELI